MLNLKIPNNIAHIKDENILKMLQNPQIQTFLKANDLDITFIGRHYLQFMTYWQSIITCENCHDLSACKQKSNGQCIALKYLKNDDLLLDELVYCPFKSVKEQELAHLKYFVYSDIPEDYQKLTFENAASTANDLGLAIELAKILKGDSKKGLYIYGNFGVGKTYLCMSLLNSLAMKQKKVAFVKVGKLVEKARTLTINDKYAYDGLLDSLMKVPYLCLDDIGTEGITAFSRDDLLFNILDYRMEHKLTTIFTSNADIEKLTTIYQFDKYAKEDATRALRLIERIVNLATPYCLKGANLRLNNK